MNQQRAPTQTPVWMAAIWIVKAAVVVLMLGTLVVFGLHFWLDFQRDEHPSSANPEAARLAPVADSDSAWLGTYQLYTASEQLEFRPGGEYHEKLTPLPGAPGGERSGSWTRAGARVVAQPAGLPRPREFELGLLDGQYALLGEVDTWRRIPDAVATSSSR